MRRQYRDHTRQEVVNACPVGRRPAARSGTVLVVDGRSTVGGKDPSMADLLYTLPIVAGFALLVLTLHGLDTL